MHLALEVQIQTGIQKGTKFDFEFSTAREVRSYHVLTDLATGVHALHPWHRLRSGTWSSCQRHWKFVSGWSDGEPKPPNMDAGIGFMWLQQAGRTAVDW